MSYHDKLSHLSSFYPSLNIYTNSFKVLTLFLYIKRVSRPYLLEKDNRKTKSYKGKQDEEGKEYKKEQKLIRFHELVGQVLALVYEIKK